MISLGFGRRDFTPDGPVSMNSVRVGTEIAEPLMATCLAWQDGEETVLSFSLDLRGVGEHFSLPVREKVSQETGIPVDHIIITVTHNHSSPDISSMARLGVQDWYDRIGLEAIVSAAKDALLDLAPVTSAVGGVSVAEKVAFVRRFLREDGTWRTIGCKKSTSPIVAAESEADPRLRAVRISREGKKDVVLINFQTHAAHCLSTDPDVISSDFVGAMREHLEKEEEFFTVYYQGACGNVNTFARLPQDKEGWGETYRWVGVQVGEAVKKALARATSLNLHRVFVKTEHLTCTVNHQKTHLAEKAREIQRTSSPEKKQELMDACGIENRYEVSAIIKRSAFGKTREMPLSVLILGDLAMGFAPVELFDACGKAFREASAYPMTFFSGYTNAAHSYMPSATAYPHGGYEVMECHYVPGTGERIALKLAAMVNEDWKSNEKKQS